MRLKELVGEDLICGFGIFAVREGKHWRKERGNLGLNLWLVQEAWSGQERFPATGRRGSSPILATKRGVSPLLAIELAISPLFLCLLPTYNK